jgi:hypothetical protein
MAVTIYVRMDVRIGGYFSKPKEVREQKRLGKHWSKGTIKKKSIYKCCADFTVRTTNYSYDGVGLRIDDAKFY